MKSTVLELARRRRSVRSFKRTPIKIEEILDVLEVARQAPSGANRQPWRFLVITKDDMKRKIRERCEQADREFHERAPEWMKEWFMEKGITWRKPFLEEAPILILVFGKSDEPHWSGSVWIAVGQMLLAIEERGLSTLTYTPSKTREINKLLGIPEKYVLLTILPIGLSNEKLGKKKRLPLSEIAHLNEWGKSIIPKNNKHITSSQSKLDLDSQNNFILKNKIINIRKNIDIHTFTFLI